MKATIVIVIFLFSLSISAQDQGAGRSSIYHVNRWVSGTIVVAGAAGSIATVSTIQNKPEISDAELATLNPNVINGFDSWALHQSLPNLDNYSITSLITLITTAGLPLTLFLDKKIKQDFGDIFWMLLEVNTIAASIYETSPLGPLFQNKFRPIVYYEGIPLETRKAGLNRNSFYSGHVAAATTSTLFMAKVYSDYNPDVNKFLLYSAAALPPLFLGYLRLASLDHFPSDILVGYGVGILCGVLIPQLHRITDDDQGASASPRGTALSRAHRFPDKNISVGAYTSPTATGITFQVGGL